MLLVLTVSLGGGGGGREMSYLLLQRGEMVFPAHYGGGVKWEEDCVNS